MRSRRRWRRRHVPRGSLSCRTRRLTRSHSAHRMPCSKHGGTVCCRSRHIVGRRNRCWTRILHQGALRERGQCEQRYGRRCHRRCGCHLHTSRPGLLPRKAVTQPTTADSLRGATPHHKCAVTSASSMSHNSCAADSERTSTCPELMSRVFVQKVVFHNPLWHF